MRKAFAITSILILLFFAWQIWDDYARPYIASQKEFKNLLLEKGGGENELNEFKFGVRQRWIEKLNRVDRCETCHLGIDDTRFEDAPQPFKTHPDADLHSFDKFGCTVCHGGQGQAASVEDAHGPTENWYRALYQPNFMQNSCSLCHGESVREQAPVLYTGREMFDDYGCRGCHKVEGQERVKVGPPIKKIRQKVKTDWLYRWIKNPKKYLPYTKMPDLKLSDQEVADITRFLIPQTESKKKVQIEGSYERGEQLFRESRCITCHSVEGKGGDIGPDLAKVSSKIHPEYLYKFIKNPQGLLPDTLMPTFGFSDQEVRDLVAFLSEEYIDIELEEEQIAQNMKSIEGANVQRGKELIETYGCTGCHEIEGVEDEGEIGLKLTTFGDSHISKMDFGEINVPLDDKTVPNWIYNKMKNSRLFKEDLKMPDYSFSDIQAEAITTYLLSLKSEEIPASYVKPFGESPSAYNPEGKFGKVLEKYRCLVCHKINGRGGELAPDLSQEGSRARKEWLKKFMKMPYAIRPILVERMPRFKLSDSELETIYSYFRNVLVDNSVEELSEVVNGMSLNNPGLITMGKKLYYEKYACNSCHQINLKGGSIGPDLTTIGEWRRTEWIVRYLRDPKAFLKRSVEPVYKLTDRELEALTAFLINPKKEK